MDDTTRGPSLTLRTRILAYGSALLPIIVGPVIDALIGGVTGEAFEIGLVSLGLIALLSLVFLEVGQSEDRARAREEAARSTPPPAPPSRPRLQLRRPPRRPH